MRDNFSCEEFPLRPRDCVCVARANWLVILRSRLNCPIGRTYRQVLQKR
jgi:hypothetical protein